jgi:nucleoside-diphosphate-sugar epimerase
VIRTLITGGAGFLGRRLVELLAARGDHVTAIVRRDSPSSHRLASVASTIRPHDGRTSGLQAIVDEERPDVVVHLASRFLASHTSADIDTLVDDNVHFGLQLLEAMRTAGVRRFVCAGTSWQHFDGDEYRPVNLYAATKQAFEDLVAYYVDAGDVHASHLRLFDLYGPSDERRKLMRYLIDGLRSGQELELSPGEQLLDFVYVDDAAAAFIQAIDRHISGTAKPLEVFAVSSGRLVSVRELVALLEEVAGAPMRVRFGARPYRPREVMTPWRGGMPVPGWSPRTTLREGLTRLLAAHV